MTRNEDSRDLRHTRLHESAPGWFPAIFRARGDTGEAAPTVQFVRLMQQGEIPKPDLVVCPGDLSDQADLPGLEFAWRFLRDLASLTEHKLLLSTVGNHDVDSRYNLADHDPKGTLLGLNPGFPVVAEIGFPPAETNMMQLTFWTHNFYIVCLNNYRFVGLNSSAYHGMGRDNHEFEHGRISSYTLHQLKHALEVDDQAHASNGRRYLLNILLCHHHLEKDGLVDDADRSQMTNAHALVDMMSTEVDPIGWTGIGVT